MFSRVDGCFQSRRGAEKAFLFSAHEGKTLEGQEKDGRNGGLETRRTE